jgi:hypothetical protein
LISKVTFSRGAASGTDRVFAKLVALALAWAASACDPELVVGTWGCPPPDSETESGNADASLEGKTVDVPWTTSFETGFCDYARAGGYCYSAPDAAYEIVDAPVRSGQSAAAFSVTSDSSLDGVQARCFLEGELPTEAVYGAWFYLPALAENTGNWNLMHFQGGEPPVLHGLWDVSLGSAEDGSLFLYPFDFLGEGVRLPDSAPEVPIESWFHVELRLRRAMDATGEVALYQDGVLVMELTGLVTDDTDFGQWYVGNLADALTPSDSTIYVDDVTARAAP